jgi:ATP-binding cassette subfamily B protein
MSNQGNKRKNGPMGGGPTGGMQGVVEKPKNFKGSFKKLVDYMKKYKIGIIVVVIFAILSTIFSILGPDILGDVVTDIYTGLIAKVSGTGEMDFDIINKTLLLLLSLYILSAIFSYIQGFIMNSISCKVSYELRKDLSEKINKLPMRYFDKKTHGEILSRVTNDVDTLSQNLSQSLSQIITSVATIIGVLVMMIKISGSMTIATLLILPLSLGGVIFIVSKSQKYFKEQQEYLGSVNGIVEEVYGGHDVVKAFNGEEKALQEFDKSNTKLFDSAWKSQFLSGIMWPLMSFVGNISYVMVSILGGYLAVKGKITVGNIVSFTQYVRNFNQPIAQLAQISSMLQSTVAAAERVFEFLEEEEEVKDVKNAVSTEEVTGNIEFKDVNFGYNENQTIINDFNAKVKSGQKIAIEDQLVLVKLLW